RCRSANLVCNDYSVKISILGYEWKQRAGATEADGPIVYRYVDWLIDGVSLTDLLHHPDEVTPFRWCTAEHQHEMHQRLLLAAPADLPGGRRSLLLCPICADPG